MSSPTVSMNSTNSSSSSVNSYSSSMNSPVLSIQSNPTPRKGPKINVVAGNGEKVGQLVQGKVVSNQQVINGIQVVKGIEMKDNVPTFIPIEVSVEERKKIWDTVRYHITLY